MKILMTAPIFKIGDIVQLKSGGPKMTVTNHGSKGEIYCSWFGGSKKESAPFPPDALKVPEPEEKKGK